MTAQKEKENVPGGGGDDKDNNSGSVFKPKIYPQVVATLAATLAAFGMGTVEAWTSPALPKMEEEEPFGRLDKNVLGFIASSALLGAMASGPPIGFLVNTMGRKGVLIMVSVAFVTGYALMAASHNLTMFFTGRVLTGVCAGGASLVAPIYVAEISEKSRRGLFGSSFQLMATLGILFTYVLGTFVSWQWLAVGCGVGPLIGLVLLLWVPASPRYLLSRKKNDEAMAALMWLRGADCPEQVQPEFQSIMANLTMYSHKKKSIRDFFKMRTIKPMGICLMLLLFQQLSGIEAVLMYTVHIFREAGSNWDPNYCAIIVGALQVVATFSEVVIVDRAGRRKLLLLSELGAAVSTLMLAAFFYFKETDPHAVDGFGWIPLLSLAGFITFFAIGIGPVPFLLIGELNSPRMVGLASAIGTSVNWGFGFTATFGMIYVETTLGVHWCFAMFAGISFLGVVFVWLCCPETKGRTMEEIQKYFQKVKKVQEEVVTAAA